LISESPEPDPVILGSVSGVSWMGRSLGSAISVGSVTVVELVSIVVSGGLGSVLMISARVDSCESELSLAGLVGELTGEI